MSDLFDALVRQAEEYSAHLSKVGPDEVTGEGRENDLFLKVVYARNALLKARGNPKEVSVIDYATAPVTGEVYGNAGIEEIITDAWVGITYDMPPNMVWSDRQHLTSGPRHLFLAFEQGCNTEACVFALKVEPDTDMAWSGGFGLRYLPDDPDGAAFPQVLRDWWRPMAELIDRLAADSSRPLRDRHVEVMTALLARIAEHGIVRAQEFDEDGTLIGLDRDVAADLPAAWAARVAEETT